MHRLEQVSLDTTPLNLKEQLAALRTLAGQLKPQSKEDQLANSEVFFVFCYQLLTRQHSMMPSLHVFCCSPSPARV